MIQGSSELGAEAVPQPESHDEFLELCALATSGSLTGEERKRLEEHLAICPSCRESMRQYEETITTVIPALAPGDFPKNLETDPTWSQERAEALLFARLAEEEPANISAAERAQTVYESAPPSSFSANLGEDIWRHVWLQYAAAILLVIALGLCAYQIGMRHGTESANIVANLSPKPGALAQSQVNRAGNESSLSSEDRPQRDAIIAGLRQQLAQQTSELTRLRTAQTRLEAESQSWGADRDRLAQERETLAQQLSSAQVKVQNIEQQLDASTRQTSQDAARVASLTATVNELTHTVHDREQENEQQRELLAHDRDIRELIGARDLYIAEVYDVARTGATQKPYGRVFYTKGKSLIFYAYDLNQQNGIKNASTFQAWGRRGTDPQQSVSLGMFYEDNATKKRWIMRANDPKTLAQIDAVFVTVEPNGGSHRPSGKPFLFAYLRIDPNHQ